MLNKYTYLILLIFYKQIIVSPYFEDVDLQTDQNNFVQYQTILQEQDITTGFYADAHVLARRSLRFATFNREGFDYIEQYNLILARRLLIFS